MATEYISLEDAAALLGIPAEQLVQLRSSGSVRGFKDGTSWKFPMVEIQRLRDEGVDSLLGTGQGSIGVNDDSADNIFAGDLASDGASGSDIDIQIPFPASEENLLSDLPFESNEAIFVNSSPVIDPSDSDAEILPNESQASSQELFLGIGGDSDQSVSGSRDELFESGMNVIDASAPSASQDDMLVDLNTDSVPDAIPAIDVTSASDLDLMMPGDDLPEDLPEATPVDDLIPEAISPASEVVISDKSPAATNPEDSDDDLDLSLDREPSFEEPSDALDIDLSLAEPALSDADEIKLSPRGSGGSVINVDDIDLSLSEPALSDAVDLGLSDHEPATGESDLNLGGEDPSDIDIVPAAVHDSAIVPPSVDLGNDSDSEPASDHGLVIDSPGFTPSASNLSSNSVSDIDLDDAVGAPSEGGSGDLFVDQSGRISLSGSSVGDVGSGPLSGIGSSGIGSRSMVDPTLAPDDDGDLVISEDGELVLDEAGSDLSDRSGVHESGINLMAPSDSGLSLESEPLDLAGSSISALDLGAEASDLSPGSASSSQVSGSGSLVDFQADDEFQLSPGMGLDLDDDSASQVIDVEDSHVVDAAGQAFAADDPVDAFEADDAPAMAIGVDDGEIVAEAEMLEADAIDDPSAQAVIDTRSAAPKSLAPPVNETQFSLISVLSLAGLVLVLLFAGTVIADAARDLSTDDASRSVSPLTQTLIDIVCN